MKRLSFNDNWLFCKQGGAQKIVTLPHDAMMEEMRSPDAAGGSACAFFPGGIYEYEKTFPVPEEWKDKTVLLQFEGVYKNSTVYINGKKAGSAAYGYIPFFFRDKRLAELRRKQHYSSGGRQQRPAQQPMVHRRGYLSSRMAVDR